MPNSFSKIVIKIVLMLLAVFGLKYLSATFSPVELLEQADARSNVSGCGAALPLYDRAVTYGAGFPGFLKRGICHMQLQQFEDALDDWSESVKADPASPGPHILRADLLGRLSRTDEARIEYDQAVTLANASGDANAPALQMLRAEFLRQTGDLDDASVAFQSLRNGGDANVSARATFQLADIQIAKGEAEAARTTIDDGLKQWPDDPLGVFEQGILELSAENKPQSAVDSFSRSLALAQKYRMQSILLNAGVAVITKDRADQSSYYSYNESFVPRAYQAMLLLDVARSRLHQDGSAELSKSFDDITFALRPTGSLMVAKPTQWPTPIIRYYLNEVTEADMLAQAENASQQPRPVVASCTAHLFAGLWLRGGKQDGQVQQELGAALTLCPSWSLEHGVAELELRGRNVQPQ